MLSAKHPFWELGFRPFFLLGALWGALALIYWILFYSGQAPWLPLMVPISWHAHEMLIGFTGAIIVGFVFTASQNWSGVRGVHGVQLQFIVLLWLIGRLGLFIPHVGSLVGLVSDVAFLAVSAVSLIPQLKPQRQNRNKIFFVIFGLLMVADVLFHTGGHLSGLMIWAGLGSSQAGHLLAMGTVLVVITLIAGRVIPFFTSRVVEGATFNKSMVLDVLTIALTLGVFVFEVLPLPKPMTAFMALLAAAAHGLRWIWWRPMQSRKIPILWVLYLAYAWFVLGFFLKGLALIDLVNTSAATHAFTAGVISTMILGMISRVTLGHTGRQISASRLMIAAYVLLTAAAVVRVMSSLMPAQGFYITGIFLSGVFWISAFVFFLVQYTPMLLTSRRR